MVCATYEERLNSEKRSTLEIIYDMLRSLTNGGLRKTQLANRARLDFRVMERHLALALSLKLVKVDEVTGLIHITDKGRKFIAEYEEFAREFALLPYNQNI
ncbi:MAG: winged helix-turn-helix domain-containing protein [Fervidicoccaceae archaeon]